MERTNVSILTEFVLVGLSAHPKLQTVFFVLVLWMYLMTLLGNGVLISVIIYDSHLHTPMYFFICNLSFLDICYTSSSIPLSLDSFLTGRRRVSFSGCMVQMFLSFALGVTECVLLGMMALDRYAAICKPLHYIIIMSRQKCYRIIIACCTGAFVHSASQFLLTIFLPFCGPNEIDHYFCDLYPLLELACTDTYGIGLLVVVNSGLIPLVTFMILMASYFMILYTIRTSPAEGRAKALSTCSSHITVVVLFFVPALFIYIRPATTFPEDKVLALFYTIIAPMFNPLIYTLRNMEMKNALRKVWCQKPCLMGRQVI